MYKEVGDIFRVNEENAERCFNEDENDIRGKFDRDRDRILYSRAFRRLHGKTQVFISGEDDHIRNRLSHTLEVAQLARTITKALNLNESLAEAIALGHDIGHTPFGHVGERTLNYIMNGCDELRDFKGILGERKGFKHNLQSIRVVTELESHSENYKGLNLTLYTMWGMLNHSKIAYSKCKCYYMDNNKQMCTLRRQGNECNNSEKKLSLNFYKQYLDKFNNNKLVTIEGLIVAIADEIAQRHHDVEDALEAQIITYKELTEKIYNTYSEFYNTEDDEKFKKLVKIKDSDLQKITLSSFLVNLITRTLIENINIKLINYKQLYNLNKNIDFEDKKNNDMFIENLKRDIDFSEKFKKKDKEFQKFIWNRILNSHKAQSMDGKGNFIIREIFKAYLTNPQQLPDKTIVRLFDNLNDTTAINYLEQEAVKDELQKIGYLRNKLQEFHSQNNKEYKEALMRTICDYIAGMTDKYALSLYSSLYENKY